MINKEKKESWEIKLSTKNYVFCMQYSVLAQSVQELDDILSIFLIK